MEEEVEIEEESDIAFGMIQDEVNEEEEKASVRINIDLLKWCFLQIHISN